MPRFHSPPASPTRNALFRFLVDENVPRRVAVRLRALGHDVVEAGVAATRGSSDDTLWRQAASQGRIFVTRDVGATALSIRPSPVAIVLLRGPDTFTAVQIDAMFGAFWDHVDKDEITGHVVSVRPGGYRVHRLRP